MQLDAIYDFLQEAARKEFWCLASIDFSKRLMKPATTSGSTRPISTARRKRRNGGDLTGFSPTAPAKRDLGRSATFTPSCLLRSPPMISLEWFQGFDSASSVIKRLQSRLKLDHRQEPGENKQKKKTQIQTKAAKIRTENLIKRRALQPVHTLLSFPSLPRLCPDFL